MDQFTRVALFSCLIGFICCENIFAEPASDYYGTFPGCEWQIAPGEASGKTALFCPNTKGKMWRVSFNEEFDRDTLERARAGNPHAIGILGQVYLEAFPPIRDRVRSLALLTKASELHDVAATRELAWQYWLKANPSQPDDYSQSTHLFHIAAEGGDARAMTNLSDAYAHGWGVEKDLKEALRWMQKAASTGNHGAKLQLCDLYSGREFPEIRDTDASFRCYREAADAGDGYAMQILAQKYADGNGVPQDAAEAKRWQDKIATLRIAQIPSHIADLKAAVLKWGIERAASSAAELGDIYFYGRGVDKDLKEAIGWYEQAAEAGDGTAAFQLERVYRKGIGVPADPAHADAIAARLQIKLGEIESDKLVELAEDGSVPDMKRLAVLELGGTDLFDSRLSAPKNVAEGAQWMLKAAAGGNAEAMFLLSQLYASGVGLPKDEVESKIWLGKAAVADPISYAPIDALLQNAERTDFYGLINIAFRLFMESRRDEAVFWRYEAELRARAYSAAHSCGGRDCMPIDWLPFWHGEMLIDAYAVQDITKSVSAIDRAIAWDESHSDIMTPDPAAHVKARDEMRDVRAKLLAQQKRPEQAPAGTAPPASEH